MTRAPSFTLALALAALAGCAVGPTYKRPDAQPPAQFRDDTAAADARSAADLAWWDLFKDPDLEALIDASLAHGFDARIAATRVEEARAIAAQVHGQLYPGVGYSGTASRGRNTLLGNANPEGGGVTSNGFDGYIGAAWEFDLWGRVRRLDEQARAQYLATEEARRGVLLSLVSGVATAYYELLELDEERAIAERATQSFGESLDLFNRQLEGGVVSRLDTASAEAAKAAAAARIPQIEMEIAEKENEISILVGRAPGPIVRSRRLFDHADLPEVPAGLPSELLERRPDIREAEANARAANANIGVTIGGFLPKIGLTALFGGVSQRLADIGAKKAGLWSLGANVSGPLFEGGTLHGQYDQAKAAWNEAKLQYEQTALSAFGDVADALVMRQRLAEVRVQQEHAVSAYEDAVRISTERYTAGRASYFEVLQAQQELFPAQSALAQTRRDEFTTVAHLYEALGGGWNLKDLRSPDGR